MAISTKSLYQNDQRWIWKLVLRVVAIVVALVGISCVAWVTEYLRQWVKHRGQGSAGGFQTDMFILPWLLLTLTLSTLYNTATTATTLLLPHHHPISCNVALTCETLLLLSLLASGIWLSLAATTPITGSRALTISSTTTTLNSDSSSSTHNSAVEIIAILSVFTLALLHALQSLTIHLTPHPTSPQIHHLTPKPISRLPLHPALRPLPYPNPNHPTCAYAASPTLTPPMRAARHSHRASPLGVHVKEGRPPLRYEEKGDGWA